MSGARLGWLAAGAALGGVAAYDLLSGRRLLLDSVDRLRLARASVEAWSDHWAHNPRRSEIVACLTTTPGRVAMLGDTLKSLLYQSLAPRRIRLHLPERSRRDGQRYPVPAWLSRLPPIEICRCEDQGPATKLLPALRSLEPDALVLVVDDDMLYPPDLVERMAQLGARHPGHVIASSGWRVPPDFVDRPTTLCSNLLRRPPAPVKCTRVRVPYRVDVVQGYAGALVRPRFYDPAVHDYARAPTAAYFVDDVWLSGHCLVPRVVYPGRRYCFERYRGRAALRAERLGRVNRGPGPAELRNNTIVLQFLRGRFEAGS